LGPLDNSAPNTERGEQEVLYQCHDFQRAVAVVRRKTKIRSIKSTGRLTS